MAILLKKITNALSKSVIVLVLLMALPLQMTLATVDKVRKMESHESYVDIDSAFAFIDILNIEHPDIVKAQLIIESGYGKRHTGNNLFGMNVARKRPNTAINNSGKAIYSEWKMSIIDYALFQAAYCRGKERGDYLDYICKFYAEDHLYRKKIEWVIKNKIN